MSFQQTLTALHVMYSASAADERKRAHEYLISLQSDPVACDVSLECLLSEDVP